MPTDIQSVIVYLLVIAVLFWLFRRLFLSLKKGHGCGNECSCSKDGVKRNPVIDRYIKRHQK